MKVIVSLIATSCVLVTLAQVIASFMQKYGNSDKGGLLVFLSFIGGIVLIILVLGLGMSDGLPLANRYMLPQGRYNVLAEHGEYKFILREGDEVPFHFQSPEPLPELFEVRYGVIKSIGAVPETHGETATIPE